MFGLFPCIPILGVFIFYCFYKKGITEWRVQVLLWNLSWIAAFNTTDLKSFQPHLLKLGRKKCPKQLNTGGK